MKITAARGAIAITLDRPRILFFDTAATWLLAQKYGASFVRSLYTIQGTGDARRVALTSPDALRYFLWAGLQAEISDTDEVLTEEEVGELIKPWTFEPIFNATVMAITGGLSTPVLPGKSPATAASPRVASRKASTTTKASDSSAVH
jgi:hypothetical protein